MHMPTLFHGRLAARRAVAPLPNVIGLAGALAGLGGGLAMALISALLTHALDQDRWLQLKVIASLFLGPAVAAQSGFVAGPILVGALIHLAVAALLVEALTVVVAGLVVGFLVVGLSGKTRMYSLPPRFT